MSLGDTGTISVMRGANPGGTLHPKRNGGELNSLRIPLAHCFFLSKKKGVMGRRGGEWG